MLEQPLAPTALEALFENAIIPLPVKPVTPTKSWKTVRRMRLPVVKNPVDGKAVHTYSGKAKGDSHQIVSATAFPKQLEAELANVKGRIEGLRVSRHTTFNGKSGTVAKSTEDMTYELAFESAGQLIKLEASVVLTHHLALR